MIFLPKGSGYRTFFVPGGGEFVLSKKFPGGLHEGRWSGLELTDTLLESCISRAMSMSATNLLNFNVLIKKMTNSVFHPFKTKYVRNKKK